MLGPLKFAAPGFVFAIVRLTPPGPAANPHGHWVQVWAEQMTNKKMGFQKHFQNVGLGNVFFKLDFLVAVFSVPFFGAKNEWRQ